MDDRLVTVAQFQYLPEAEAARLYLERAGFQVFLADAEMVNAIPLLGGAMGYIKLQVAQGQSIAAQQALNQRPGLEGSDRDRPRGSEQDRCLACGTLLASGQTACPACGWSYVPQKEELPEPFFRGDESAAGIERHESPTDVLTEMKRPIFWLMLSPYAFIPAFVVAAILAWFLGAFRR